MEKLIEQLKVILGTNFGLYFKSHTFHWNIEGSDFVQYHNFLSDFYTSVFENIDGIAEKLRMLNVYTPTSINELMLFCDINFTDKPVTKYKEIFQMLLNDNERFIIHIRAGIVVADMVNEFAISNYLQGILEQHQKFSLFIRSINKGE